MGSEGESIEDSRGGSGAFGGFEVDSIGNFAVFGSVIKSLLEADGGELLEPVGE